MTKGGGVGGGVVGGIFPEKELSLVHNKENCCN